MNDPSVTLDISILGREYRVACKASEKSELLLAVKLLDGRMREIRDSGKVSGADRIAVMAALNMANEMLRERDRPVAPVDDGSAERRIVAMQAAIDRAMSDQDKLI